MAETEVKRLQMTLIEMFKDFIEDSDNFVETGNIPSGIRSRTISLQMSILFKEWRRIAK